MPDFTLRAPDSDGGGEFVVGNAADRALLLARGYTDVTSDTQDTAPDGQDTDKAPTRGARARVREAPAPVGEVNPSPDNT